MSQQNQDSPSYQPGWLDGNHRVRRSADRVPGYLLGLAKHCVGGLGLCRSRGYLDCQTVGAAQTYLAGYCGCSSDRAFSLVGSQGPRRRQGLLHTWVHHQHRIRFSPAAIDRPSVANNRPDHWFLKGLGCLLAKESCTPNPLRPDHRHVGRPIWVAACHRTSALLRQQCGRVGSCKADPWHANLRTLYLVHLASQQKRHFGQALSGIF